MKKPIVIGSIVFAGCIIVAGMFVFRTKFVRTTSNIVPTVTVAPKELLVWDDPAGFSFKYPNDLTVNKHDEDTKNYAHVELTSTGHAGNIIIWAKDTTYQTVAEWIKGDATVSAAPSVDTTLGLKEAKKLILSGTTKKMITAAIDEDVLVTVEGDMQTDEAYWTDIYAGIVQTFAFTAPNADADTAGQTVPDAGQFDEEEVLE